MLGGDAEAEILEGVFEEDFCAKENLRAFVRGRIPPSRKGGLSGSDGHGDFLRTTHRDTGNHGPARRIKDRTVAFASDGKPFSRDIEWANGVFFKGGH